MILCIEQQKHNSCVALRYKMKTHCNHDIMSHDFGILVYIRAIILFCRKSHMLNIKFSKTNCYKYFTSHNHDQPTIPVNVRHRKSLKDINPTTFLSESQFVSEPNVNQMFSPETTSPTSSELTSVKFTHRPRSALRNAYTSGVTRAVNHRHPIKIRCRHRRTAQLRRLLRMHLVVASVGLRPGRGANIRRLTERMLSGMPRRSGPHEGLQRQRCQPAVRSGTEVLRSQVHLRSM